MHQVKGTFLCPEAHPLREKGEINQRISGQSPFCLDMGLRKKMRVYTQVGEKAGGLTRHLLRSTKGKAAMYDRDV